MRTFTSALASLKNIMMLVMLLGGISLTGCESINLSGEPKLQVAAVSSVTDYRASLLSARKQVQKTLDATNAMPNSGSRMPRVFANFQAQVTTTHDMADVAAKQVASLRVNEVKHNLAWQLELNKLNNPEKNQVGEARQKVIQEHFENIREKAEAAQAAYGPFLEKLTEIDVYLQHDMTMRGINVIRPVLAEAQTTGETLIANLNEVIAALDALTAEMANVGPGDPAVTR